MVREVGFGKIGNHRDQFQILLDHINRAITEVMPLQGTVLPGDIPQLGIMFLIHVMKIDMEPIYHFIRIVHRIVTVYFQFHIMKMLPNQQGE